jgi:hypothetical protein
MDICSEYSAELDRLIETAPKCKNCEIGLPKETCMIERDQVEGVSYVQCVECGKGTEQYFASRLGTVGMRIKAWKEWHRLMATPNQASCPHIVVSYRSYDYEGCSEPTVECVFPDLASAEIMVSMLKRNADMAYGLVKFEIWGPDRFKPAMGGWIVREKDA